MFKNWFKWFDEEPQESSTALIATTTEQIHKEFDDAEQEALKNFNELLQTLEIPTETQLERKSNLLKELGFNNSEIVKQAETLETERLAARKVANTTETKINLIQNYKIAYPNEKIIPTDSLKAICKKYNLIFAPVSLYIKDVPEKNLLEIKNSVQTRFGHKEIPFSFLSAYKPLSNTAPADAKTLKNLLNQKLDKVIINDYDFIVYCEKKFHIYFEKDYALGSLTFTNVDRTDLYIAAPISHFNVDKTTQFDGFEYVDKRNSKTIVINDPIVFRFLKGDMIRIISKWGTEDDQSFSDPSIFNEQLN